MRYSFILAMTVICLLSTTKKAVAQIGSEDLSVRLGGKLEELRELSTLAHTYKFTDFLSYDVVSQFADSANVGNPLEQATGTYRSFDELFWGQEGNNEFLQGYQYYLEISHGDKRIYVYDRLPYARMINVPLIDSVFNQASLMDLNVSRPGGVYKKLVIHYNPGSQHKQVHITYDSTNYALQSIRYYIDAISFSDGFETCQTLSDTLTYPSTGVAKPAEVSCAVILQHYKNFIVEYPDHTTGATVKVFVPAAESGGLQMLKMGASSEQKQLLQEVPPLADTVATVSGMTTMMSLMEGVSGTWVDSIMDGKQLFEWYMGAHLNLKGYTYENYADWLINSCGHKLNQLPWSDEVFVRQDTLQNIWNRFAARYPSGLLTILDTVTVPIMKSVNIQTGISSMTYTDGYITAMTWTNGGWYTQRMSNVFNLSLLPRNATIQNAQMDLHAWKDTWITASHFRYASASPFLQAMILGASCIPGQMDYDHQPDLFTGSPVVNFPVSSTDQVNSGSPTDFWSNQDYFNQNITPLVQGIYDEMINRGICLPVLYKLNDESLSYKRYVFGGPQAGNGKAVTLRVMTSSARKDFFTAFVNRALGTYLSFEQAQSMFALYGKLIINADATVAVSGPGCAGEAATPFTGVRTVNFSNMNENEFDISVFGESRFIYKQGDQFFPVSGFANYEVIRAK